MPSFTEALVAAAVAEHARFRGLHETHEDARPMLVDYWRAVPGYEPKPGKPPTKALQEIADRTAWSAAFISFVVRKALAESGVGASFAFAASHSVYAGAAIRNDFDGVTAPAFRGLPPRGAGAERPRPGDLLGFTRTAAIEDYEDALRAARRQPAPDTYFSHFDVVTKVDGTVCEVIGGNVADSVTLGPVRLDADGLPPHKPFKFSKTGQVLSGPYICLIRLA